MTEKQGGDKFEARVWADNSSSPVRVARFQCEVDAFHWMEDTIEEETHRRHMNCEGCVTEIGEK